MAEFLYKTRGNSSPQKKPRVYFSAHPDDYALFDAISRDILAQSNCAIYYDSDPKGEYDHEEYLAKIREMNLLVIPVTEKLLREDCRAMTLDLSFAQSVHIPILPLMQEEGLTELFNEKFGNIQYLDKNAIDKTAISFEEKLSVFLASVLVGDELASRVRAAFDAYIFLSYRKKDRQYAQELMRLIHENDFCRDIAIWYDEFLTPGEDFNDMIAASLEKSALFALAVTPNLVNEENYVMTTEYPMAQKAKKPILPAEVVPTNHDEMTASYRGIPEIVDAHDGKKLSDSLLAALSSIALRANDSDPEHNFFIGLAYLSGIDVERNPELALSLITSAAEAGLPEAIKKLAVMYQNGEGVERDFEQSIVWNKRLIEYYEAAYHESCKESTAFKIVEARVALAEFYSLLMRYEEEKQLYEILLLDIERFSEKGYTWISHVKIVCANMLGRVAERQGKLDTARFYYESALLLSEDPATKASLRERGWVAVSLGGLMRVSEDYTAARHYYEIALGFFDENDRIEDSVQTKIDLALVLTNLGDIEETFHNYEKALSYYEKTLALAKRASEESASESAYRQEAIAYKNISDIYVSMSRLDEALEAMTQSLSIRIVLVDKINTALALYDLALGYNSMGDILKKLGRYDQATECYEKGLSINQGLYEKIPTGNNLHALTISYNHLGSIAQEAGLYDAAERYYCEALRLRELSCETMDTPEVQYDIAISCNRLGDLLQMLGKMQDAISYHEKALGIYDALWEKTASPHALEMRFNTNSYLGRAYDRLSESENCHKYFAAACEIAEMMAKNYPSEHTTRLVSIAYAQLGRAKEERSELEAALFYYQKSILLKKKGDEAETFEQLADAANGYLSLARVYLLLGRIDESIENAKEAVIAFQFIQEKLKTVLSYRDLIYAYIMLADAYWKAGKIEDAIATMEQAIPKAEWALEHDSFEHSHYAMEDILDKLSTAYGKMKNTDRQLDVLERLLAIRKALAERFDTPEAKNRVAKVYSAIGYAARTLGDLKKTLESFAEALEIRESLPREAYTVEIVDDLAHSHFDMGSVLISLKSKEAKPFLDRALSLVNLLIKLDPDDAFYPQLAGSIRMMLMFMPD